MMKKPFQKSFLTSLILMILLWVWPRNFPEVNQLFPAIINNDPIQTPIEEPQEFILEKEDHQYLIKPRYEYELWGLVVTHNLINIPFDVHNSRERDLCVIWGENLKLNLDDFKFTSGNFTCYVQSRSRESWSRFDGEKLSNNHLLAHNPQVKKTIAKARVGDQIYLKGKLSDYYEHPSKRLLRKTSTVRNDTGNGACETIFVEEFKILKKAQPVGDFLRKILPWFCLLSFFGWIRELMYYPKKKNAYGNYRSHTSD